VTGAFLAVLAFVFSACTAGTAVPAPPDNEVLVLGQIVYTSNCASCHGGDGGGGRGVALNNPALLEAYPEPADLREMIAAGRRTMPGFGGRLTDEQLDAVVGYTREVLVNAANE
jgi:mono/diheme cytochrome c family protein